MRTGQIYDQIWDRAWTRWLSRYAIFFVNPPWPQLRISIELTELIGDRIEQ